jgi:hypothetical protein
MLLRSAIRAGGPDLGVMTAAAILVRTHTADEQVLGFIARLSQGGRYPVFVLADESRGPLDFGATPKISLTEGGVRAMGLYAEAPNLFWRCGDYGLYAARAALPEIDRFWLIEPDVWINLDRPAEFFARFEADPADLLAAHYRPAEPGWDWGKTMADGGPVQRCLFPLVRVTARALDHLFEERCALGAVFTAEGRDPRFWPNDEVFTATMIVRARLDGRDLNHAGPVYDPETFCFWFPSTQAQAAADPQGFVRHPVLSGDRYFQKLFALSCRLKDFSGLEGAVEALTGSEWSAAQAEGYRAAIARAKAHLAA